MVVRKMQTFYWMHKDDICTKVDVDLENGNEYEVEKLNVYFENYTEDPLLCLFGRKESPVTLGELYEVLNTRIAPRRDNTDRFVYKNLGLKSRPFIEDLLFITKGMLVDDFFWFCRDAENRPSFKDLRTELCMNRPMMKLADLHNIHFTPQDMFGLPSIATTASQPKFVYNGWFIKLDRWGYEAIAEMVVSILAKYTKNINAFEYILLNPCYNRGVCASPIYTDAMDMEFVSFWTILTKSGRLHELPSAKVNNGEDLLNKVIEIITEETGIEIEGYIKKMLMWDALILNTDRHYNNMAIRRKGDGTYTTMPFFDHGLSLLSGVNEENDFLGLRARIYTDSFRQYINLAGEENRLEIDIIGLGEHLAKIRDQLKPDGYYSSIYKKVETILFTRLLDTKGITWYAVGREANTINSSHYLEWQLFKGFNSSDYDYAKEVKTYIEEITSFDQSACFTDNMEDMAYGKH